MIINNRLNMKSLEIKFISIQNFILCIMYPSIFVYIKFHNNITELREALVLTLGCETLCICIFRTPLVPLLSHAYYSYQCITMTKQNKTCNNIQP